jgi:hypothetical protein
MQNYIHQLALDLEAAILARWHEHPPHWFQVGYVNDPGLMPPEGYTGPPAGYAYNDPNTYPPLPDFMYDDPDDTAASEDQPEINLEFEKSIAEMEKWRDEDPPQQQDMFYHFGFQLEQFPKADLLTDAQLEVLCSLLVRLWAAYNFTAAVSETIPKRLLYPKLIERMHKPTFVMTRGNIGIEFCHYDPDACPWGGEWCGCKE